MGRNRSHADATEVGDRARQARPAAATRCSGFVLNDGTPLKSVEVQIDDGPWQKATLDPAEHAVFLEAVHLQVGRRDARRAHARVARDRRERRRAADGSGLARKKTFLEDNSQFPRKVRIG